MAETQAAVPPDTGRLLFEIKKVIVGQDHLLERLMVSLLARGHLLVEGVPGLAKTLSVKTIAQAITGDFKRIQFTPDLVPADLVGTRIYNQRAGDFQTSLGPVFTNLLLADEINRAPAKVQSALLEVMQERQVTIGRETHKVPDPFLVMATQNPIETEGTYALPEAQVDRFMLKVIVGYPTSTEEFAIVVGNPFALTRSLSTGVISGLDRSVLAPTQGRTLTGLIQFDAAVNPGSSGGPLVNRDGEVVGIVTGLVNPTGQPAFSGVGFAVTIDTAAGALGVPPD